MVSTQASEGIQCKILQNLWQNVGSLVYAALISKCYSIIAWFGRADSSTSTQHCHGEMTPHLKVKTLVVLTHLRDLEKWTINT